MKMGTLQRQPAPQARRPVPPVMMFLGLLLSVIAACASPPTSTLPPAAPSGAGGPLPSGKPRWEQRWEEILAAARTEGRLTIYSSNAPETRQQVGDAIYEKFGIRVEWVVGGGSNELVQKILAERNANIYNADAMLGGTMSTMNVLKPAGYIEPMEPDLLLPEVTDKSKWFQEKLWWVDTERTHLAYAAIAMPAIVINTDMVRNSEMASYRELLNPKWKGKILMDSPLTGGPGNTWLTAVGELIMGMDYLREFARQEPFMLQEKRQEHEWLARGRYPILIGGSTDTITQFKRAGVSNLEVITPREGTWLSQSNGAISLIKKSPHPNAARVLLNWVLSKEGQTVICRSQGFQSARVDVPTDWVEPWTLRQPGVKYHDTIAFEQQLKKNEYIEVAKRIFASR